MFWQCTISNCEFGSGCRVWGAANIFQIVAAIVEVQNRRRRGFSNYYRATTSLGMQGVSQQNPEQENHKRARKHVDETTNWIVHGSIV